MVEKRLEKILEDKTYVFSSCFAPISCSVFGPMEENGDYTSSRADKVRFKQQRGLQKLEGDVKKHVAQAIARKSGSLMSDDDDEAFLTELEAQVHDLNFTESSQDSREYGPTSNIEFRKTRSCSISEMNNTLGDSSWDITENDETALSEKPVSGGVLGNNINATNSQNMLPSKPSVKQVPAVYKRSVRSKFEFYRKQHAFATLSPVNENMSHDDVTLGGSISENHVAKAHLPTKKPTLPPLETQRHFAEMKSAGTSPASRRNEFVQQMLKRRQTTPYQGTTRVAFDP